MPSVTFSLSAIFQYHKEAEAALASTTLSSISLAKVFMIVFSYVANLIMFCDLIPI